MRTKRASKSTWTLFSAKVLMGFLGSPTLERHPLRWNSLCWAPTAQPLDLAKICVICPCTSYCFQYAIKSVAALVHHFPAASHIKSEFCIHDKDYPTIITNEEDTGIIWMSLTSRHILQKSLGVKLWETSEQGNILEELHLWPCEQMFWALSLPFRCITPLSFLIALRWYLKMSFLKVRAGIAS